MPRVPTYNEPQVQANALPGVQQSARTSGPLPNGLQAVGQGLHDAAAAYQQVNEHADELRVEDAFNKFREKQIDLTVGPQNGYMNATGSAALPQDGQSLSDRYTTQFKQQAEQLADGLSNDRQKALFKRYADRAGLEFISGLQRHESQQLDQWRTDTVKGVMAVETDNAVKNYNNQDAIALSTQRIELNLGRLQADKQMPPELFNSVRTQAISNLHASVIESAIQNRNLDYAQQYMAQHSQEMDAKDILKVQAVLGPQQDLQVGYSAARRVYDKLAHTVDPSDGDRLTTLVFNQESGNQQLDKDGKPITSPKGATGIAQIMPATGPEAAKLAGVPWDETKFKTDAGYNKTLGTAYLNAQIQKYGDLKLALAAYNAGPGVVDDYLNGTNKTGKNPSKVKNDGVPPFEETQQYVAAILGKYQAGGGAPQRATLADIENELRNDPDLRARPASFKIAHEEASRLFTEQEKARKQRMDDAEGEVYRQLAANGGNYQALDPKLRAAMDPTKLDSAMQFATKLRKGETTVTNMALYQKLATDPGTLKGMSDNQFYALRPNLSDEDFKHFSNERAKLTGNNPTALKEADDLNGEALNRVLHDRLWSMKLDPTPKDGSSDAERVGALRQFVTRSVLDAQKQAGHKFTDAEVTKHIDGLFATNATFRSSFLGISGGASQVALLSLKPSDVPDDAKRQIKAAFQASGREASDAEILQAYWIARFGQKKSALAQAKAPSATTTNPLQGK